MARSLTMLLTNVSANVDGDDVKLPDYGGPLNDGIYSIFCWATSFGGGTVTIQVSPDGVTWFTARSVNENQVTFTQGDVKTAYLKGVFVRARLTGASGASGLNVGIAH